MKNIDQLLSELEINTSEDNVCTYKLKVNNEEIKNKINTLKNKHNSNKQQLNNIKLVHNESTDEKTQNQNKTEISILDIAISTKPT